MSKNLILTVIIVAVVALAVVLGVWYLPKQDANENANANANANVNRAQVSLPPDAGDIPVDKSTTYRDTSFKVTTASKTDEFHTKTAATGEQYVILFLAPTGSGSPAAIFDWISADARLLTGGREIAPSEVKLVSTDAAAGDSGYLWFTAKDGDKDFTLQFGTGDAKKTIALGF
jgi:hypothetical protein